MAQSLQPSIGDAPDFLALPISQHDGLTVLITYDDVQHVALTQLLYYLFFWGSDLSNKRKLIARYNRVGGWSAPIAI